MNAIVMTAMLLMTSVGFAQDLQSQATATATRWTCEAIGRQGFNSPGGDYWERVIGHGADQLGAAKNALDRCFSYGLRECRVGGCWKK